MKPFATYKAIDEALKSMSSIDKTLKNIDRKIQILINLDNAIIDTNKIIFRQILSWQGQDEHYHEKTLKKLSKRKKVKE